MNGNRVVDNGEFRRRLIAQREAELDGPVVRDRDGTADLVAARPLPDESGLELHDGRIAGLEQDFVDREKPAGTRGHAELQIGACARVRSGAIAAVGPRIEADHDRRIGERERVGQIGAVDDLAAESEGPVRRQRQTQRKRKDRVLAHQLHFVQMRAATLQALLQIGERGLR